MSNLEGAFPELYDEEEFRDKIATVDEKGKRIWVYPKKPHGSLYNIRKIVSYVLIAALIIMPWLKWNGEPLFMANVLEGKLYFFGLFFGPQDAHLIVLAFLSAVIFIVLFTVIFGRVFCGWICPQTIFMEMVYRRIEYAIEGDFKAQRRLNKAPWTSDKIIKKGLKQIIFFAIAVFIANVFLTYIIGTDAWIDLVTDPISQHITGFIAMVIFSFVFYAVFSVMREQVCTTICPYGRLQGVLLDDNSLAVQYDNVRGEPRGRIKKGQEQNDLGDCIDCKLCVQVCPTGIDIRDGIQLECVNCTACIDACNEVMEKVNRPQGLIRVDSLTGIEKGERNLLNKRTIAYSGVLIALLGILSFLFINRSDIETLVLRTPGTMYYENNPGEISNMYNYQLINKTDREYDVEFKVKDDDMSIEYIGKKPHAVSRTTSEGILFIKVDKDKLEKTKTKLLIEVYSEGELIDKTKTVFLGPMK